MTGVDGDSSHTSPLWEPDDVYAREKTIAELSRQAPDILSDPCWRAAAARV
jgi:hypothetical protein